jgi:hypothetical protein
MRTTNDGKESQGETLAVVIERCQAKLIKGEC